LKPIGLTKKGSPVYVCPRCDRWDMLVTTKEEKK